MIGYFASSAFATLAPATQRVRRNILENFRKAHGDKRIALLHRGHIDRMLADKATTPAVARNFLIALRALMAHCVAQGWCLDDPAQSVKLPPIKSDGIRTWTEEEISQFESAHPVGSRARLALALLLYTAQHRSDVIRLGPQHLRDGAIHLRQQKTGVTLTIPAHPSLKGVLEATLSKHLTFLTTRDGKPFSFFRRLGSATGSARHAIRRGYRAAFRHMDCVKRHAGASPKPAALPTSSQPSAAMQRYARCSDIRSPPIRREWRGRRSIRWSRRSQQEHPVANLVDRFAKSPSKYLKSNYQERNMLIPAE